MTHLVYLKEERSDVSLEIMSLLPPLESLVRLKKTQTQWTVLISAWPGAKATLSFSGGNKTLKTFYVAGKV